MTGYELLLDGDSAALSERAATHLKGMIFDTQGAPLAGGKAFFAADWYRMRGTNVLYRRFGAWTLKLSEFPNEGFGISVWGERRAWELLAGDKYFICPRLDLTQAIAVNAFEKLLDSGLPRGRYFGCGEHTILAGLTWSECTA